MNHWQKEYGGITKQKPDFTKCAHDVVVSVKWNESHQCGRSCGHGPDVAYCKTHAAMHTLTLDTPRAT